MTRADHRQTRDQGEVSLTRILRSSSCPDGITVHPDARRRRQTGTPSREPTTTPYLCTRYAAATCGPGYPHLSPS